MKHIKLFEINDEAIGWRQVPMKDWESTLEGSNPVQFRLAERTQILNLFEKKSVYLRYNYYDYRSREWKRTRGREFMKIELHTQSSENRSKIILDIYKLNDDWFLVEFMHGWTTKVRYYVCDEFDGLMACLKDIKDTWW